MDLKRRAIRFLDGHGYCTIATVNSEVKTPQSTLVRYGNHGLILYMISAKERRKVTNISINPSVSVVVYGRSFLLPPSSMIVLGSATILEGSNEEAVRAFTSKRFPAGWINSQAITRARRRSEVVFIRVEARRVVLNKYSKGFISAEVLDV